jgi:hypothetical protein
MFLPSCCLAVIRGCTYRHAGWPVPFSGTITLELT